MLNKVVTLEDDKEYCIISEIIFEGNKYYCGVDYFDDNQDIGNKYYIFREYIDEEEVSLELVTNIKLVEYLLLKMASLNDQRMMNGS